MVARQFPFSRPAHHTESVPFRMRAQFATVVFEVSRKFFIVHAILQRDGGKDGLLLAGKRVGEWKQGHAPQRGGREP